MGLRHPVGTGVPNQCNYFHASTQVRSMFRLCFPATFNPNGICWPADNILSAERDKERERDRERERERERETERGRERGREKGEGAREQMFVFEVSFWVWGGYD